MVYFKRRTGRAASRRFFYRRRVGRRVRRFRRSSFRRFPIRRFLRRRRYGRKSRKQGGTKKFLAVVTQSVVALQSDEGPGGFIRTFALIGTTDAVLGSANAVGGNPPSGSPPTWGSYWRQPITISPRTGMPLLPASTSLINPIVNYNGLASTSTSNMWNCGVSMNMAFKLGDIGASTILPWAKMYSQVRCRRINIRLFAPRYTRTTYHQRDAVATPAAARDTLHIGNMIYNDLGGEMVFMCTKSTGVVEEEKVETSELITGTWVNHTGYGQIKENPRLRKRAVFRSGVAYGMRPVYFSFRPGVPVTKSGPQQRELLGVDNFANELQGFLAPSTVNDSYSANQASASYYVMRAAPWMDTVMPTWGAKSNAAGGGASTVASHGNQLSTGSYVDLTARWINTPLFGLYLGLQPQTSTMWPWNLRMTTSFSLEFRGFKNMDSLNNDGLPYEYHKEWGNLPTLRTSRW